MIGIYDDDCATQRYGACRQMNSSLHPVLAVHIPKFYYFNGAVLRIKALSHTASVPNTANSLLMLTSIDV